MREDLGVSTGNDAAPEPRSVRAASPWQPIETAPKDGTKVWVYHCHASDPYCFEDGALTSYGSWVEGLSMAPDGQYEAAFVGGYYETHHEYGTESMPDCWFAAHDEELPLSPTHWMPLPPLPENMGVDARTELQPAEPETSTDTPKS